MDGLKLFTTIRCDLELLKVPDVVSSNVGWNQNPSPFYMLDFHRDRMLKAAIHWGWDAAIRTLDGEDGLKGLETFLRENVTELADAPHSAKVLIDKSGNLSIVTGPTGPVHLNNLFPSYLPAPLGHLAKDSSEIGRAPERNFAYEVLVDGETTTKSEFTHFKTTHRPMYEGARHRASINNIADKKEVLLVNKEDGSIMEGSITTPYFWRNGRWVTPPVAREFALAQGSGGNSGTTRRWALERNLVVEEVISIDSLVDGEECWISNALRGFIHGRSYVHSLLRYNIDPTKDGPYFRKSNNKQGGFIPVKLIAALGGRVSKEKVLVKKLSPEPDAEHGEVTAEDSQNDMLYLCKVAVGTPPQELMLDFDTGSADFWIKYGDGSYASGECGTDTLTVGGLAVKKQTVETASELSEQFVSSTGDGLLGLAFSTINTVRDGGKADPQATPMENMVKQGDIPKEAALFTSAFYSSRDTTTSKSFYTFGFIDQELVKNSGEEIHWVEIDKSDGFWAFSSESVSINGESIPLPSNMAIADTGTTLSLMSDDVVDALYAQIPGATYDWSNQGWIFPITITVDDLPEFKVAIGDKEFLIQKEDLAFAPTDDGESWYGGVQSRGSLPFNIYGDSFLKSIYVIWDQGNTRFGVVPKLEETQNLTPPTATGNGEAKTRVTSVAMAAADFIDPVSVPL
ncbi:hypothetical protein GQX73_g3988 [Xylaria multiplex]|uniref:Peptidase A1 domain-containing protein n=1 Tax=Xylaria multiplex TaxID=323545 RepID=A0A7C8N901_9PEZI|nr:hypothetical protein GQX73_g3988 [Xylaria multiplex]